MGIFIGLTTSYHIVNFISGLANYEPSPTQDIVSSGIFISLGLLGCIRVYRSAGALKNEPGLEEVMEYTGNADEPL